MNTIHILPDTELVSLVAGEDPVLILYMLDAAGALFQNLLSLLRLGLSQLCKFGPLWA